MRISLFKHVDWAIFGVAVLLMVVGLITNYPPGGPNLFDTSALFTKQVYFVTLAIIIMIVMSRSTYAILRGPMVSVVLYFISILVLLSLLLFAQEINGAKSWFFIGSFAIQPVDFIKIVLIIVLARYFAVRHIHIRHIRHVLISLGLVGVLFILTLAQPDAGSSLVLLLIWAGMIFVSGVSRRHIIFLLIAAIITSAISWQFLPSYQQDRVLAFLNPLENLSTTGYNAYQAKVAIGSGMLLGKGIGEGTQSKLQFLPLYESDFVFAAFAEEVGFIGVSLLLLLFTMLLAMLLMHANRGRTNFETLFMAGVTSMFFAHMVLHIGGNTGLLPITGITLPFVSYGGSHLIVEAIALGMVMGMATMQRMSRKEEARI